MAYQRLRSPQLSYASFHQRALHTPVIQKAQRGLWLSEYMHRPNQQRRMTDGQASAVSDSLFVHIRDH